MKNSWLGGPYKAVPLDPLEFVKLFQTGHTRHCVVGIPLHATFSGIISYDRGKQAMIFRCEEWPLVPYYEELEELSLVYEDIEP